MGVVRVKSVDVSTCWVAPLCFGVVRRLDVVRIPICTTATRLTRLDGRAGPLPQSGGANSHPLLWPLRYQIFRLGVTGRPLVWRSSATMVGGIIYGSSAALGVVTPTVDRLPIEAPVASNLECRQLLHFDQAVNRRGMYPQVFCNVFEFKDRWLFARIKHVRGILHHRSLLTNCQS